MGPARSEKTGKERQGMDYKIVYVMGHVEVYDSHGEFLFSADTEAEALEDLAG